MVYVNTSDPEAKGRLTSVGCFHAPPSSLMSMKDILIVEFAFAERKSEKTDESCVSVWTTLADARKLVDLLQQTLDEIS